MLLYSTRYDHCSLFLTTAYSCLLTSLHKSIEHTRTAWNTGLMLIAHSEGYIHIYIYLCSTSVQFTLYKVTNYLDRICGTTGLFIGRKPTLTKSSSITHYIQTGAAIQDKCVYMLEVIQIIRRSIFHSGIHTDLEWRLLKVKEDGEWGIVELGYGIYFFCVHVSAVNDESLLLRQQLAWAGWCLLSSARR